MKRLFTVFTLFSFLQHCRLSTPVLTSNVIFTINHARNKVVVIETVPFAGERAQVVDSALISDHQAQIRLRVQYPEERPYRLKVRGTDIRILFIHDGSDMTISGNILFPEKFQIVNSKTNTVLYRFLEQQQQYNNRLNTQVEELKKASAPSKGEQVNRRYDSLLQGYYKAYRDFADTVTSPGAFLYVYNYVDFGKDYRGLNDFIQRTATRFPGHQRITRLREKTIDYLKTFEIEFAVGDSLPALKLPDLHGFDVWIRPGNGRYLFIDFWSSWCRPCLRYVNPIKALEPYRLAGRLDIISIALDAERAQWKEMIRAMQFNGTQLIDDQVWSGPVIHNWRIDSIPFNFLVDPAGRIIDKAIPAEVLVDKVTTVLRTSGDVQAK